MRVHGEKSSLIPGCDLSLLSAPQNLFCENPYFSIFQGFAQGCSSFIIPQKLERERECEEQSLTLPWTPSGMLNPNLAITRFPPP
jgi:hypothetical protein